MNINWLILLAASLIPMVIGFVWYNPNVLGKAWQKATGLDDEKLKGANMGLIFGVSLFCSFLIAMAVNFMVIHQFHLFSILAGEPGINDVGSEANNL